MPSVKNPNVPNKLRKVASRAKVQKSKSKNAITKNPRGTASSSVIFPTSGKFAPLSGKKARKVAKAQNYAKQRALEKAMAENGESQMTDAPKQTEKKAVGKVDEEMNDAGVV